MEPIDAQLRGKLASMSQEEQDANLGRLFRERREVFRHLTVTVRFAFGHRYRIVSSPYTRPTI
jgi:hypothetical protein